MMDGRVFFVPHLVMRDESAQHLAPGPPVVVHADAIRGWSCHSCRRGPAWTVAWPAQGGYFPLVPSALPASCLQAFTCVAYHHGLCYGNNGGSTDHKDATSQQIQQRIDTMPCGGPKVVLWVVCGLSSSHRHPGQPPDRPPPLRWQKIRTGRKVMGGGIQGVTPNSGVSDAKKSHSILKRPRSAPSHRSFRAALRPGIPAVRSVVVSDCHRGEVPAGGDGACGASGAGEAGGARGACVACGVCGARGASRACGARRAREAPGSAGCWGCRPCQPSPADRGGHPLKK
eukprot:gene12852-biopygen12513